MARLEDPRAQKLPDAEARREAERLSSWLDYELGRHLEAEELSDGLP